MTGLEKLESVRFFQSDLIRHPRSDVEIARVYANREFFDNFESIVEDDAKRAYRFQRRVDQNLKDRDDIYLEVRDAEQRRKRKRLALRVVILPNWDMSDEDLLDSSGFKTRDTKHKKPRRLHSKPAKRRNTTTKRVQGRGANSMMRRREPLAHRSANLDLGYRYPGLRGKAWIGWNTPLKTDAYIFKVGSPTAPSSAGRLLIAFRSTKVT
jgi:hypothetical protein